MKILTIITSYNRKKNMMLLAKKIVRQGSEVIVFDDCSNFEILNHYFVKFDTHFGKKGAWQKFKYIFSWLHTTDYDYYILIPDDIQIDSKFIANSLKQFNSIKTSNKLLNLLTDNRLYSKQWTDFTPIEHKEALQTQWTDMCFICNKEALQSMHIQEIHPNRWEDNELLGSGVGGNLSRWLNVNGCSMFHPYKSIVKHGKFDSLMNPEERKINNLKDL